MVFMHAHKKACYFMDLRRGFTIVPSEEQKRSAVNTTSGHMIRKTSSIQHYHSLNLQKVYFVENL